MKVCEKPFFFKDYFLLNLNLFWFSFLSISGNILLHLPFRAVGNVLRILEKYVESLGRYQVSDVWGFVLMEIL